MLGFFVVDKLVRFGSSAIELASDLEEVQNVVDTTFGNMAHEVDAFARSTLESFGLSELASKRYMGTLGAMLKSMGASTEKAYEMSKGLTELAYDLSSFFNISLDSEDGALFKVQSGIAGELEPLRRLGFALSEASLQEVAFANGVDLSIEKMTEAQMHDAQLLMNTLHIGLENIAQAYPDYVRLTVRKVR
jgi:hypothetical protein